MFRLILLAIVAVSVISASFHSNCDEHFENFKAKHRVKYADENEHAKRKGIFCARMREVDELNAMEPNRPPAFGVTKFSDRTAEEFSVLLGRKGHATPVSEEKLKQTRPLTGKKHSKLEGISTSGTVDWTEAGMTTPVKNQGQCGSCWAHSATEQIESEFMLNGNAPWPFSVQQVTSCTRNCFGCGGGDTPAAYEYLKGLPQGEGLGSDSFAPYIQSMTDQCLGKRCTEDCDKIDLSTLKTKSSLTGYYATVEDYSYAVEGCTDSCANQNMTALAAAIAEHGPASICVNAAKWSNYAGNGAVMTVSQCGGFAYDDLDHCVQLTGYNADAETPYWMVRNSWSTDWGNDGYIYLEFADNANPCGIADEATFVQLGESKGEDK